MKRVFDREVFRSIGGSLGRFLAIAGIVALGCGFYAGLRMTGIDMRIAGDAFFDGTSLYDIRMLGTLGYTDDQVEAIENVEGVQAVMPARSTDVMAALGGEQYSMRVNTLDIDAAAQSEAKNGYTVVSSDSNYLNRLVLAKGSWPTKEDECVLSADRVMSSPIQIGDTVQVLYGSTDLDGVLDERTYTVVGLTHSSSYVSDVSMGSTSLGNGSIQQYMYVSNDSFSTDCPYTEVFVKVAGADDEFAGSDAYQAKVDTVSQRLEDISDGLAESRLTQVKAKAQKLIDEKSGEYTTWKTDADAQLADAKSKLDDALSTIEDSQAQVDSGWTQYYAGVAELAESQQVAQQRFAAAEAELDMGQTKLPGDQGALDASRQQWQAGVNQVLIGLQDYGISASTLPEAETQLDYAISQNPPEPILTALKDALSHVQALEKTGSDLDAWQSGLEQIASGRQTLADQKASAQAQFAEAQATLDSTRAQLVASQAQIDQGRADYESGLAAYEANRADVTTKLDDAATAIANAQKDSDSIGKPSIYVLDRTKNYGAASFKSDSERVDNIAAVFPFIFFLVAALVALTTMTRMVDEDRVLIGTFKALGYSKARITWKYLVYAGIASISGAVIGILVLSQVLPWTICRAYAIIYNVPQQPLPLTIDLPLALLSAGMGVGITLFATWAAVAATLREQPAHLMLPRVPRAGKRILLERVTPLWRRMSFSWKVTCRNLFRYKKRLTMTIIGIAGCTALLLTGLGLHDAIWDIIDKQFDEVVHYNVVVTLKEDASENDLSQVLDYMSGSGQASTTTLAQKENMQVSSASHDAMGVEVTIPEDDAQFTDLLTMRDRITHEAVPFDSRAVVMTEKLANTLNVRVGQTFMLYDQDDIGNPIGDGYSVTLTGIMENYVGNALYMGSDAFAQDTGKAISYRTIYGMCTDDMGQRAQFTEGLHGLDNVETVAYNDETIDSYRKMLSSVNMIVIVLVTAAAALAFIVLYNLTNINITERRREIASLKVLGFTPREVDAYIYREIILLTLLGAALGLVLGVYMEGFVVVTAEVDYVMFGRDIHALSFVWAFAMTAVFSAFVMLFMRRKLGQIDMVESLKSVE